MDIKLKDLTDMARDRSLFVCQSMSMNIYLKNSADMMPQMIQYYLYAWKLGLKTLSYYCRTIQSLKVLNFSGASSAVSAMSATTSKLDETECVVCSA
jgi:ribonucleotide reductase alpha subunit